MALNLAQVSTDLTAILGQVPISMTFGSVTRTVTRTMLRRETVLADEGLLDEYRFSVYTNVGDWTTTPARDDLVTISGTEYIVLNTEEAPGSVLLRLDLGEENAVVA